MKNKGVLLVAFAVLLCTQTTFASNFWKKADNLPDSKNALIRATQYLVYTADQSALKNFLFSLPGTPGQARVIELPLPNGTTRAFRVWEAPIMEDGLATRYPGIKTFSAVAVDNANITAKLDFTLYGFHAMIFDDDETSFIDPYDNSGNGYYTVHYKRDETEKAANVPVCGVKRDTNQKEEPVIIRSGAKQTAKVVNGAQLRTYRLALSANHQYSQAATGLDNPTIAQVLSKMTTSMNRINGVYGREMSVIMNFVANEDTLIWTTNTGGKNGDDPFGSDYVNSHATDCNGINQTVCDARIGNGSYDVGHVFTSGAGGYSQVGVICRSNYKARSATGQPNPIGDGFDIDYVVHEMGHEFGAEHTLNNGKNVNCGQYNRNQPTSYEPGSGSTIMAYAGICTPDDLQPHSDDYFHAVSLLQIQYYLSSVIGSSCGVKTDANNKPVTVPAFSHTYTIPFLTPFELTAPAITDAAADTLVTYGWEQWNLGIDDAGDEGTDLVHTTDVGPIFRSYHPSRSPTRVFPRIDSVLTGTLSSVKYENAKGEKVPDVARFLTFKLTVRGINQGLGAFVIPADSILLDAVNTGEGFTVTSQNKAGGIYNGNSTQTITWNNVGSDKFPVNTPNVDIYMSADGGFNWPYHIGTYLNSGSATVTLPNPDTTIIRARIKVKGTNNVFFNVNGADFSVIHSGAGDTLIEIRPNPVRSTLRISSGNAGLLQTVIYNAIGQVMWRGEVNGELDLAVNYWARGVYFLKFIDVKNQRTIKKFVVQ